MKVLTKDTNEQFNVRPANDYDVKNGHAITDLEILDADGNNTSAWLKADECFILTETGDKVEHLNSKQTEKLEEIYDAETEPEACFMCNLEWYRVRFFFSGKRRIRPQPLRSDSLIFCKKYLSAYSNLGYPD